MLTWRQSYKKLQILPIRKENTNTCFKQSAFALSKVFGKNVHESDSAYSEISNDLLEFATLGDVTLIGHCLCHAAQGKQVSISPIFYEQLFRTKGFCAAFVCLEFEFVIFWWKDFGAKKAHKMLVKLTPGDL
jgi:hypothetical protein